MRFGPMPLWVRISAPMHFPQPTTLTGSSDSIDPGIKNNRRELVDYKTRQLPPRSARLTLATFGSAA